MLNKVYEKKKLEKLFLNLRLFILFFRFKEMSITKHSDLLNEAISSLICKVMQIQGLHCMAIPSSTTSLINHYYIQALFQKPLCLSPFSLSFCMCVYLLLIFCCSLGVMPDSVIPMDCSTPVSPVFHFVLELAQIYVH